MSLVFRKAIIIQVTSFKLPIRLHEFEIFSPMIQSHSKFHRKSPSWSSETDMHTLAKSLEI